MALAAASIGFGFAAGVLSTLSPCVLPLLPLVVGPAMAAHRLGVAALAAGLAASFVAVGLFVATVGFSIGLDGGVFRAGSAVLLGAMGIVLLVPLLKQRVAMAAGGVSTAGNRLIARFTLAGLPGQFVLGALLGAVWSPCVGPTLGAASLLAAQGRDLPSVAAVMVAFGLGAGAPLLVVGALSRQVLLRWRGRMLGAGRTGTTVLGAGALAVSVLILSGMDRTLETALVSASPAWLTDITTRF
jgi:cytochrome c-type biogenesis protein